MDLLQLAERARVDPDSELELVLADKCAELGYESVAAWQRDAELTHPLEPLIRYTLDRVQGIESRARKRTVTREAIEALWDWWARSGEARMKTRAIDPDLYQVATLVMGPDIRTGCISTHVRLITRTPWHDFPARGHESGRPRTEIDFWRERVGLAVHALWPYRQHIPASRLDSRVHIYDPPARDTSSATDPKIIEGVGLPSDVISPGPYILLGWW